MNYVFEAVHRKFMGKLIVGVGASRGWEVQENFPILLPNLLMTDSGISLTEEELDAK